MTTEFAKQVIRDIAAKHYVHPYQIIGRSRIPRLLPARIEVAKLLSARGYSSTKIGKQMHKDHTTVLFYLGTLGRKPIVAPPKWRKPHIAFLGFCPNYWEWDFQIWKSSDGKSSRSRSTSRKAIASS